MLLASLLASAAEQLLAPPVFHPHAAGTFCSRDPDSGDVCIVCGVSLPCSSCYRVGYHADGCPKAEVQLPPDFQAALRSHYWSMAEAHGLGAFSANPNCLELEIAAARDGGLACAYADGSIRITRRIADALLAWHSSASSADFVCGSPADAHLTLMHETLHRCGYILRPESWGLGLRGSTFVSNVDELVTELAARQILAVDLGITASAIYCTSASRGSYDELIIATARALCWAVDCTEREAIDRLARAALRLRRDTPVSDALTALGRLVELAADEPAVSL